MSERPVPRRHSPWVDDEVYKREVKAHRCNDRVEDVIYENENGDDIVIECYAGSLRELGFTEMLGKNMLTNALFEGNPFKTIPGPFKLFYQCMRSKPGEEPTDPFFYLDLDPPKREAKPE